MTRSTSNADDSSKDVVVSVGEKRSRESMEKGNGEERETRTQKTSADQTAGSNVDSSKGKPRSAWMIFLMENMERFKKMDGGFMNVAGEEWKRMTKDAKATYVTRSEEEKRAYEAKRLPIEDPSNPMPTKPSKPKGPWMCYLRENMERFKGREGGFMSAAGTEWKTMSAEAKQKYVDMSVKEKERYASELAAYNKNLVEYVAKGGSLKKATAKKREPSDLIIPVGRMKRLIKVDEDAKTVTQAAYVLITKAVEEFVGALANKTYKTRVQTNRKKTIRDVDVRQCIHRTNVFGFLDCDFPLPTEASSSSKAKRTSSSKTNGDVSSSSDANAPKITGFFGTTTTPATSGGQHENNTPIEKGNAVATKTADTSAAHPPE